MTSLHQCATCPPICRSATGWTGVWVHVTVLSCHRCLDSHMDCHEPRRSESGYSDSEGEDEGRLQYSSHTVKVECIAKQPLC